MEADWEFEVGGDAPVIEACWPGFIDLRLSPQRARDLPEAVRFPALAAVLETLNSRTSSVWTSKCDFWPTLDADTFDPDELDAAPASCAHAVGCYIDLLPGGGQQWSHPHLAEGACRQICSILRQAPMRNCRVDLVVRRATVALDVTGLGITAYLTACGPTAGDAERVLAAALAVFGGALIGDSTLQ